MKGRMDTQNPELRMMDDEYEEFVANTSDRYRVKNATMSPEMLFTSQTLSVIIVYCICFLVAAIGNLTVFVTLSRGRYRKSRISLMICHLSLADLLVTFIGIPTEVGWRVTVQWVAGNAACKIFAFFRAFGLYLSSNILVCVSLDRYFAVLHPLRVNDARRRGKWMLILAWICSTICALPQCFVYNVLTHPDFPEFQQCVTFDSGVDEVSYTIFCVLAMYFVPLVIICWAYTKILCEINSRSRESSDPIITRSGSNGTLGSNATSSGGSRMRLRRSDMSSIERARSRTLRMTITIVAVFIFCWTPYVAMLLWYMMDRESAKKVDQRLQDASFLMAVVNSCANPLVYGSFAVDLKKECCRCFLPYSSGTDRPQIAVRLIHRNTATRGTSRNTETSMMCVIPSGSSSGRLSDPMTIPQRLPNGETHPKETRRVLKIANPTYARDISPPMWSTAIDSSPSSDKGNASSNYSPFAKRTGGIWQTLGKIHRRTLNRKSQSSVASDSCEVKADCRPTRAAHFSN